MVVAKVGYMFTGPRSCPRKTQQQVMDEEGIKKTHVYWDKHPSRAERTEMLTRGLLDRKGGIVVIAAEPIIASLGRERRSFLKRLAELGVRIQVAHGEPRLYETDEEIEEFVRRALVVSRKSNGHAIRRRTGRPSNLEGVGESEMAEIRRRWHDLNFTTDEVVEAAIRRGARPALNRKNLNAKFGPRRAPKGGQDA